MPVIWTLLSLFLLYISKYFLVRQLSRLIHRLGGSQHGAIITWSIIFLPGTIIHEISHFLVAAFTGARTGKIEIFPEYLEEKSEHEGKNKVALGYVQTQTLNPIQGFLVGIAPFVSGLLLLIFLVSQMQISLSQNDYQILILEGYFFFTIANSFFPSWPDIKQTLPLIVISIIALLIAFYFGFQIMISPTSQIWLILNSFYVALLISTGFNLVLISILYLINQLFKSKGFHY